MKKNSIKDGQAGLVTIIVPVYKSEDFIRQCIDSVLNQTYKNLELILVDDESPDNSGKICDEYAKKDKRITVIHRKNGGVCEARNSGLKMAKGEYLMFVDGDDWLAKDCIEYLLKLMKDNDTEMAMSDCVFTTRDMTQNLKDSVRVLTPEDATCEIIYDKTPVGPWNKLYSMSVVRDNDLSFSVKWFGEGLYFSAMNAQLSNAVAYGHRKVYIYRKDNPNSGTTVRKVQNSFNALENILYIKDNLIVKTEKTIRATNWHIWTNNFMVITYIVEANAKQKYKKQYRDCKKYMRRNFFNVAIHSDINAKKKIKVFLFGLAPTLAARYVKHLHKKMAKKDFGGK